MIVGTDIANAANCAGYGGGAMRALDFYANGDDSQYEYDAKKRDWVLKVPLVIG